MRIGTRHKWTSLGRAMVVLGSSFVVIGGLVAAVTGPLGMEQGSWLAAYLVLVCGVAQVSMGVVRAGHTRSRGEASPRQGWVQLISLNLGNAAVVAGTLTRTPIAVDGGVVLLLAAFVIALRAAGAWGSLSGSVIPGLPVGSTGDQFLKWTYRVFLVLLLVSLPIGSVLAHVRAA